MVIRAYRLYTAGVATASAVASLTIPRSGVIYGIQWTGEALSGANPATGMRTELSTSSVSTIDQNDTPGNSISTFSLAATTASGEFGANLALTNVGVQLTAGDKLYLHQFIGSNAPNWCKVACTVYVGH